MEAKSKNSELENENGELRSDLQAAREEANALQCARAPRSVKKTCAVQPGSIYMKTKFSNALAQAPGNIPVNLSELGPATAAEI